MAGYLNRVQLLGNLGKDPDIRSFQNGGRVCNFSMATTETWKDRASGERKEKTQWHNVAIFVDGLVDVVEKYLKKGSKVFVEGQLETRKWTDQQGQDRYMTEVVLRPFNSKLILLGDSRGNRSADADYPEDGGENVDTRTKPAGRGHTGSNYGPGGPLDDDIPF